MFRRPSSHPPPDDAIAPFAECAGGSDMGGPYLPTYALRLEDLGSVWGAGRLAPFANWRESLSADQRRLVGLYEDELEALLRAVAAGREDLCREIDETTELNVGHAVELWASWLGTRVEYVTDTTWVRAGFDDQDIAVLEWMCRRGVEVDLGLKRMPWPVTQLAESPILRILTADELRRIYAQIRDLRGDAPRRIRRAHRLLEELHRERAEAGLDLVEIDWM